MPSWTEYDVPQQSGRTVLVTGANSGLGRQTARVLAGRGARVLLACRSLERGRDVLAEVIAAGGHATLVELDLADLDSVRAAAGQVTRLCPDGLDVLVNNAGVMMTPRRATVDGFEYQFGVDHLGHAALTWLLMPLLRARPGARVVTVSSRLAVVGRIDLGDPSFRHRRYLPPAAYAQAKLANLVFALELHRRARAAGLDLLSAAAHPGLAATALTGNMASGYPHLLAAGIRLGGDVVNRWLAQPVAQAALPQLYAATAPQARGGEYYGPGGLGQARGYPRPVAVPPAARDPELGLGLWSLTARLTGVCPDPA